jgi:hypothetical protein
MKFDKNGDSLPYEGLTLEGLKMIEMLSSFVAIETQKQEVSTRLQAILMWFKQEGLFMDSDSKPAFFMSIKSQDELDGTLLNFHLLQSFLHYNGSIKPHFVLPIPMPNLRNFFLKRAQLAQSLDQAYFSLQGLAQTSAIVPFL